MEDKHGKKLTLVEPDLVFYPYEGEQTTTITIHVEPRCRNCRFFLENIDDPGLQQKGVNVCDHPFSIWGWREKRSESDFDVRNPPPSFGCVYFEAKT